MTNQCCSESVPVMTPNCSLMCNLLLSRRIKITSAGVLQTAPNASDGLQFNLRTSPLCPGDCWVYRCVQKRSWVAVELLCASFSSLGRLARHAAKRKDGDIKSQTREHLFWWSPCALWWVGGWWGRWVLWFVLDIKSVWRTGAVWEPLANWKHRTKSQCNWPARRVYI